MSKKVLIVEDDPSYAEFLEVTVRSAGYESFLASDGEVALQLYDEIAPDLVLLDLLVPRKDGHAVCEAIRMRPGGRQLPIVFLTGIYKKKEYSEDARRRHGVTDYLVKPVRIVDLWDLLKRHLEEGGAVGDPAPAPAGDGQSGSPFDGVPVTERPLALLLGEIHHARRTGLVFLKDARRVLILYCDAGDLVFARSNDPDLRLTSHLVRKGVLEPEDASGAEALLSEGSQGARMGELLVQMHLLEPQAHEQEVREHLEELVLEAFRSEAWSACFVEGPLPAEEALRIETPTPHLLLRGVRDAGGAERVRAHLPGPGAVLALRPQARTRPEALGLSPYEGKMLELCDGTRTMRKILSIASLAPVDIEALLFVFLCTGLVEVRSETAEEEGASYAAMKSNAATGGGESSGTLAETPMPELILDSHHAGRSGVLRIERGESQAWLYFDAGDLVFVGSNEQSSRIGEILEECRLVDHEDLERLAGQDDEGRGRRLGQRCVEAGLVTLEELHWAMTFQMQKRLQSLLHWSQGTWSFEAGPFPTDEPITLGFETVDVVLEAVRRMDVGLLADRLPPGDHVLTCERGAFERNTSRLSADERALLRSLDQPSSVRKLLSRDTDDAGRLMRGLYALLLLGAVEAEAPAADTSLEDEAEMAMGFLDRGPKPAPRPHEKASANGSMVPKVLLDQSLMRQKEMRWQMREIYERYEGLKQTISKLQDEIRTLRTSALFERMDPTLRESVGSIFEAYLERLEEG